jgi:hypothetical protein
VRHYSLAQHADMLASCHEDLLVEAAQAGLVVAANALVNLGRLIGKCQAAYAPTPQLVDLWGHAASILACCDRDAKPCFPEDNQREVVQERDR